MLTIIEKTRYFRVWISLIVLGFGCSPDQEPDPANYFIISVIGDDREVGILVNDPISGKQFVGFGPKDEDGELDSLRFILEREIQGPEDIWLLHEIDENYSLKNTHTSNGNTIEYLEHDIPAKESTLRVKDSKTGVVKSERKKIKMEDFFYEGLREAPIIGKEKMNRVSAASMLYLFSNMAGCGLGALSLASPALPLTAYNTFQSCKSAKESMKNLYNGKPAFGCITTQDEGNFYTGLGEAAITSKSIGDWAQNGLPGIISYGAQYVGQDECKNPRKDPLDTPDKDPFEDLIPFLPGIWGEPHLDTHDGLAYDFHGYGEFTAIKSLTDNYEVQVRFENPYNNGHQATATTAIAIQTGSDKICFVADPQRLYINGQARALDFTTLPLKEGASITRGRDKYFDVVTIKSKGGDHLQLRLWGGKYFDFGVLLHSSRRGKVAGLLGNFDGNPNNDLRMPDGTRVEKTFSQLYPKYANGWRIAQEASMFYYEAGKNTQSHTQTDFPKAPMILTTEQRNQAEAICRQAGVDSEPFLSNCVLDVFVSGDPEMARSATWISEETSQNAFPPLVASDVGLQGDAEWLNKTVRLTPLAGFKAGQLFRKTPVSGDFESEFVFNISVSPNGGGDGITFLIAKDIPQLKPNAYPGIDGKMGYNGVKASLAVEFDTWADGRFSETANHVAIHTNGKDANSPHYDHRLAYNNNIIPLKDGAFHTGKVIYKNKKLTVLLDGLQVLEVAIDLKERLGLNNNCYIGFTATNSSSWGTHYIASWTTKNL